MRKTVYILLMMLLFSGLFTMAQVIEHKPRQQERQKPKVERKQQKPSTTHQKETPKSSNSDSKKNQSKPQNKNKQQKPNDKKAPEKKTEKVSSNDNMSSKVQEKNKTSKPSEKKELPPKKEDASAKDKNRPGAKDKDKKKSDSNDSKNKVIDPFGNVKDKNYYDNYKKNLPNNKGKKSDHNSKDLSKSTRMSPKKERLIQQVVNDMVYVDGGTFVMGAGEELGSDAAWDSKPTHKVTLSSYFICKYEVTQELWLAVMGNNPSYFKGDINRPVEQVGWNECQEFIAKLNQMTGKRFRLPTEAEWEFAARGGRKSKGYRYSGSNSLGSVAWFGDNSNSTTHPVGSKSPNELGLYDMSGNVIEWCQDWYGPYSSISQTNPKGPSSGSSHVFRGGCWSLNAWTCMVTVRDIIVPTNVWPSYGLRLAMSSE